jgi:hypothetical protein
MSDDKIRVNDEEVIVECLIRYEEYVGVSSQCDSGDSLNTQKFFMLCWLKHSFSIREV